MHPADRIFERNKKKCGVRAVYQATDDEIISLYLGGAELLYINRDNHDGTFGHRVVYKGSVFAASTRYLLKLSYL